MRHIGSFPYAFLTVMAILLSPTPLYAHETEIFFSQAKADNDQNEAIANVFIMLDTSGSMRWCENELGGGSGHNATWCADHTKRRINILQEALRDMLRETPEGVRIGIGRFNYNIPNVHSSTGGVGQIGGRVLVPVTEVNDASLKVFMEEIDRLNDAGTNATGPFPGAQPAGDTPTGRAYAEAARYMMGLPPLYGTPANGAEARICVETSVRDVGCRDVFDGWGDWVAIDGECDWRTDQSCKVEYEGDPVPIPGICDTSDPACSFEPGEWQPIGGTCDLDDVEHCKRELGGWGPPTTEVCDVSLESCQLIGFTEWATAFGLDTGATTSNCPTVDDPYFKRRRQTYSVCTLSLFGGCLRWGTATRCQEQRAQFQTQSVQYFTRENQYFESDTVYYQREAKYRQECDQEEYCSKEVDIIKDGRYASPMNMENQCESNHIILFTDGAPSANDTPGNQGFINCGNSSSYVCQRSISQYLYSDNNAAGREIKTYNIGLYMGPNEASMRQVSTDGADGTINADDGEELIRAFSRIIDLVADNARTFSSPGVAVNQMNRLTHLDQLFYALFEPRQSSYWDGNLKRYRLSGDESGVYEIVDAAGRPAVDQDTGFFREGSRSFWSPEDDGPDVRYGGARANLQDRKLFYTDAAGVMHELDWEAESPPAMFGLPADASQEDVQFLKSRLKSMWGDPLHSQPVLVDYGGENTSDNVVFVSGNDGMLRAIRASNGREYFSFMPHQLFRKANRFAVNRPGLAEDNTRQLYGLDGSWTAWRRGPIKEAPTAVYLYGGMRRGGYSYYAINVSNRNSPRQQWQINRGDQGFQRLGQTWSQPTLTLVRVNGQDRPVLVFGGGYSEEDHDRQQGRPRSASEDAMGNMIYIVDALTGNLLWSAGRTGTGPHHKSVPDMRWAVPSNIAVVSSKLGSNVAEHLYFGDMGGQLWRVDLGETDVSDSTVHKLADLSGSGAANNRRFYSAPSVALKQGEDGQDYYYVGIGSGYRAHPLDESVNDYFFMIKDSTAMHGVAPAQLGINQLTTLTPGINADPQGRGWKLPLPDDGEKVTAAASFFDDQVYFTTYQPGGDRLDENPCAVRMGTNHLYAVHFVTGEAGTIPGADIDPLTRRTQLAQDALAPEAVWISSQDGGQALVIGTEIIGGRQPFERGIRYGGWRMLDREDDDVVR